MHASLEDREVARALAAHGFSTRDAERLTTFVPLAFGRLLLERLKAPFTEGAAVVLPNGQQRALWLPSEPMCTRALTLAQRVHEHGTMTREAFLAIAGRSAEIRALNTAVAAGEKPETLNFSPPLLFLSEP
jgi:hypothetical protein